ncbi:hypothetical protein E4T52_04567 [Aureobasidium sp. EXF-3400]|nr:hypothetical protein E4T51_03583 [Aureobasidium sp. EXF-12344]KAI4780530.1 hypothetical protein E4T52_04567 [Aureobasidium sp. EXF-3400]
MPTQLDRALNSKVRITSTHMIPNKLLTRFTQNLFFGFAGLVAASAAWSIFGSDIFPQQPDPTGEPENWTHEELTRWLNRRNLMASSTSTKEELLARMKANMRAPQ